MALPNGHYIIAGIVYPGRSFLAEFSDNGDSVWARYFDLFWINSMIKIGDGYFLAGKDLVFEPSGNMGLIKTDFYGNVEWWYSYGVAWEEDGATSIIQTDDGGFLLSGWSYLGNGGMDMFVVKTNSNGDSLWSRTYGTNLYETAWTSLKIEDGYLLGGGRGNSLNPEEMLLVKIGRNGDSLWSRTYGSPEPGDETIVSVLNAGNSQYLLAGYSAANSGDMSLIKVNSTGDPFWSRTYGGDSTDFAFSSIISGNGNCLLAGFTNSFGAGNLDMWLLCVEGPFQGVLPDAPEPYPSSFAFHSPSPNPFNSSSVLSYELRVPSQVSLRVYDTAGRLVATLVEEQQLAGIHSATFDPAGAGGSGLASGIYLAKLQAGSFTAVQKLVLLK